MNEIRYNKVVTPISIPYYNNGLDWRVPLLLKYSLSLLRNYSNFVSAIWWNQLFQFLQNTT